MSSIRRRSLLTVTLAIALMLPAGPALASTTFGANLNVPVDETFTCGSAFGTSSCLAYSVNPSSYAPASGTVTTVRVKTGNFAQGPMQVDVLRSYYQNNLSDPGHPNYFCCFLQEYGPTFTPASNAVTAVKTMLGMVEDPVPPSTDGNTVAKDDFPSLSVQEGNVPIPLSSQGSGFTGY